MLCRDLILNRTVVFSQRPYTLMIPWLIGKDVAQVLGYSDTNKAVAMHVDEEDKLNDKTALSLGQRGGWLINESGLYSLILSSKLPVEKPYPPIWGIRTKHCQDSDNGAKV